MGTTGWVFLHCITMGYPYKINTKNKQHLSRKKHIKIFNTLGHVLPCKYCRESYLEYVSQTIDKHLNTRKELQNVLQYS